MRVCLYDSKSIHNRPEVLERLRFLTNGGWGRHEEGSAMLGDLNKKKTGWMFLVWEKGEIIAWAFVNRCRFSSGLQIGVYVQKKWRRQGVGTRILSRAKEFADEKNLKLVSHGWTTGGKKFYKESKIAHANNWEY